MNDFDNRKLTLKEDTHNAICEIYKSYHKRGDIPGKFWVASSEKTEVKSLLSILSQTELAEILALRNIGRGKEDPFDLGKLVESYLSQDYFAPLQRLSKDRKLDNWLTIGIAKFSETLNSEDGNQGIG